MRSTLRWAPVNVLLCIALCLAQQPAEHPAGMLAAYEANRDQGIGNYITRDMVLLGHVLSLEEATTQAEEEIYSPEIHTIVEELAASAAKANASPVTSSNQQFLAVLRGLSVAQPPEAGPAKDEFDKVQAAKGISRSAIFPESIDYSQFRIRGSYTRSPELGGYFQTVRYAGTVLFAVKESAATGIEAKEADRLTAQAQQLAGWITASPKAQAAYKNYIRQTGLLFGDPDDLTLADIGGPAHTRAALLGVARKNGHQPQILGGIIDIAKLEPGVTAQDALTGWRLFPQRRSSDGPAFQQLIFPSTGEYLGKQNPRSMDMINGQKVKAFPLAMELPALLGSTAALNKLNATDERNYKGYESAFAKARRLLTASPRAASWVPVLQQLLASKVDSPEASDQLTTTALAYWTRNRHRGLLYEKQTYTPVVKGMALTPDRTTAYLEPSVALYKALIAQTQALTPALRPGTAATLEKLLARCVEISVKESSAAPLDTSDVAFLNDIDRDFRKIAGRDDAPVVVDVHTNPSGNQVLEEAVGYPALVEFKHAGSVLHGARLTHFEFRQAMDQRMTDEEWQIRARTWKQQ
jgi:hypothetical protein